MKFRVLGLASVVALAMFVAGCSSKQSSEQTAPEKSAAPAATVNPDTAGTITGTVKLDGTPPKMPIIKMGADPACLKNNQGPVHAEEVVTGDNHTLQNVVIYIKSGLGNYSYTTPAEPAKLDQKGCMYEPHVLCMMTDQKLEVINSDPLTHNIHVMPKANREWNESQPQAAPPIEKSFARPEMAIEVKCNIHPWMKGYICVFGNPYFAETGEDGTFTIKNVPPGTYTVEAWQEKYGTVDQQVTVAPKQTQKADFTFKAQ